MGNHEFFQAAPQLLHQAKELVELGSRTNLLQTLTDLGHPYGLLLGQANNSSSTEFSNNFVDFFFPRGKADGKIVFKTSGQLDWEKWSGKTLLWLFLFPPLGLSSLAVPSDLSGNGALSKFSTAALANSAIFNISTGLAISSGNEDVAGLFGSKITTPEDRVFERGTRLGGIWQGIQVIVGRSILFVMGTSTTSGDPKAGSGLVTTVLSKGSILGSAKSNPESARKIHMEELFNQQAFLAPIFLKLFAGEKTSLQRSRELHIGKNSISLGTTAIKLATYRGEQPFLVKTPQGEPLAQINPGEQLGHLHVSHQAGLMRNLSPLEKADQITQDFMELFKAVENGSLNLDSKQQEVLVKAQNATLIGISHLVRLFRRRTGMPTWKLDVLPELVQRFHQHDSQAVSRAFGGSRKVKPSDVEMMVITPAMRQQLVASYA